MPWRRPRRLCRLLVKDLGVERLTGMAPALRRPAARVKGTAGAGDVVRAGKVAATVRTRLLIP